ncbi:hypothetical protein ACODT3_07970 [Streptomyces sp. 4.24]|uniref:hypothetical protein n=1 Tax=Streptomyces tritrimontium TaxID=3406573 RepID=UPI003BB6ABA4
MIVLEGRGVRGLGVVGSGVGLGGSKTSSVELLSVGELFGSSNGSGSPQPVRSTAAKALTEAFRANGNLMIQPPGSSARSQLKKGWEADGDKGIAVLTREEDFPMNGQIPPRGHPDERRPFL